MQHILDPYKEFAYPPKLPRLRPPFGAVFPWITSDVLGLAREIKKAKAWDRLPELADLLEKSGCRDVEILDHFRNRWVCLCCKGQQRLTGHRGEEIPCLSCTGGKRVVYNGHSCGCWYGQCWLLDHLLGDDQQVEARWKDPHTGEVQIAHAINPGAWFGKTWLFVIADCAFQPLYIIEGDNVSDIIDEFFDDDIHGPVNRIQPEDYEDYGEEFSPGDSVGGKTITKKGWVDLNGKPSDKTLLTCEMTGSGNPYDGDSVQVEGREGAKMPFPCRYFGPGLPEEGMLPTDYEHREKCLVCGTAFVKDGSLADECCSKECDNALDEPSWDV